MGGVVPHDEVGQRSGSDDEHDDGEDEPEEENPDVPEGLDTSIAGDYSVNSPVYLHPVADANSANLATLQTGEEIKVLGQSFGWYYLEYNGQKGYAWGTFFTKK